MNRLAPICALAMVSTVLAGTACYSVSDVAARPAELGDVPTSDDDADEDARAPRDAGRKDASQKKDATPSVEQEEEEEELSDAASPADASSSPEASSGHADASVVAPDAGPTAPTFALVYSRVIGVSCVGCHGPTHSTGLDMRTKTAAYGNLVGIQAGHGGAGSCNDGVRTRVVAGDASASLLFQKISHTNDCGSGMPLGSAKLSKTKIALVQGWINAGAPNN